MSLPVKAIDRLFERMAATYGAAWVRQWVDVPMSDVKAAWAHELSVFAGWLEAVAWALDNLPPRCPNAVEFKHLCRQAPSRPVAMLPEPAADPARVAAELQKLAAVTGKRSVPRIDHKAWAKVLVAREQAGEKLNPTVSVMARSALGLIRPATEAA